MFLIVIHVLVKINYSQWWYTVGWSAKEYQVGKSLLTNCHLEDETGAGQKCWVKTKSLCYIYSAVNKNTVQQSITKVMADVINHMYFNYFYKVSEGYSRTLNLYKIMTCFIAFLPYLPLSLSQPLTASSHSSWRWGWGSLSTLYLLHLILLPSFPFCFISSNLLLHSFLLGMVFGSVFFDLIHKKLFCACLSPLGSFWLHQVSSLMTSIKFFLLDFLKSKEFSLSSLHRWI